MCGYIRSLCVHLHLDKRKSLSGVLVFVCMRIIAIRCGGSMPRQEQDCTHTHTHGNTHVLMQDERAREPVHAHIRAYADGQLHDTTVVVAAVAVVVGVVVSAGCENAMAQPSGTAVRAPLHTPSSRVIAAVPGVAIVARCVRGLFYLSLYMLWLCLECARFSLRPSKVVESIYAVRDI